MIEVTDLKKTYGDLTAVDGISFTARPGSIFGLLGPNGAGKTTTISCISGLLPPTSGRVRIAGRDVIREPRAAKAHLGLVPQEIALYEEVSARENLRYWGGTYGLRGKELRGRIEEVLEIVGLRDRADEPVTRFSGGMKRRLNLAAGIVHGPEVLLLDEPTVGVDPQSRRNLLERIRDQAEQGVTVLYTTHYMEEAEELCDELAVIDHGRLLAQGTLEALRKEAGERDVVRLEGLFDPAEVRSRLEGLPGAEVLEAGEETFLVGMAAAADHLNELLHRIEEAGGVLRSTTVREPSLETLFIKMTGKELRE